MLEKICDDICKVHACNQMALVCWSLRLWGV